MNNLKSWVTPIVYVLSISSTNDVCDDTGKLPPGDDGTAPVGCPPGIIPTTS